MRAVGDGVEKGRRAKPQADGEFSLVIYVVVGQVSADAYDGRSACG